VAAGVEIQIAFPPTQSLAKAKREAIAIYGDALRMLKEGEATLRSRRAPQAKR
jgi:hypothetical protein